MFAANYCDMVEYLPLIPVPAEAERVYIGSALCDHYFCSLSSNKWEATFRCLKDNQKKAVLVVPCPSQQHLEELKERVQFILKHYDDLIDGISVNDHALLQWVSQQFQSKRLWAGRLLSKEMRDPRYPLEKQHIKLTNRVYNGMLSGVSIYGLEADPVHTPSFHEECGCLVGLHFPLVLVSAGRICELGSIGKIAEQKFRLDTQCTHACEKNWILYDSGREHIRFLKHGRGIYTYSAFDAAQMHEPQFWLIRSMLPEKMLLAERGAV